MTSPITGHFSRILGTWTTGNPIPASYWVQFDKEAAQSVNADDGGCWAPSTSIAFTGSTYGLFLAGPLFVWGSVGQLTSNGTSRFTCAVGDYPQLSTTHAGRSRKIAVSMLNARGIPWQQVQPCLAADGTFHGEVQTVSYATQAYNATTATPTVIVAPLEVHNGGTIASVTFSFAVSSPHTSVPTAMPKARIMRFDAFGNGVPLTSTASGADANGWVSAPTPSSGTAYYNAGAFQTFTVPCDQNNVADTSAHTYHAEITEEQNGTYTPIMQPVDLVTSSQFIYATSTANQFSQARTIDGVTTLPGMRVLVKDQPYTAQNGIYTLPGDGSGTAGAIGTWIRSADMSYGSQLTEGALIPVNQGGTVFGGSMLQMSFPSGTTPNLGGHVPTWYKSQVTAVNALISPTIPNGFIYKCTTAGTTGTTEPGTTNPWPVQAGVTVTDGSVVWTAVLDTSTSLYFGLPGLGRPFAPATWQPSTSYAPGSIVSPTIPNGYVYFTETITTTSGTTEPTWPTQPNTGVNDNGIGWNTLPYNYSAGGPFTLLGNVWGDMIVQMTNITSLAFQ